MSDETPSYEGWHNLGSRTWHDSNWGSVVTLGESLTAPSAWDTGMPPAIKPYNRVVGSTRCLQLGELVADAAPANGIDDGFPSACYTPELAPIHTFHRAASIWRCPIQLFYARLIELIYDHNELMIQVVCRAFFGNDVTIRFHEGSATYPDLVTIVCPTYSVVVMDGTSNFQQLATQAFMGIVPPIPIGQFSTLGLWYFASNYVYGHMVADGVVPGTPIMLAGHSYGGAAALILAARFRIGSETRLIRYLTFGCPKPGDQRLINLVASCQGVDIANDDDLVTILPPDHVNLAPVLFTLGFPALMLWTFWKRPPNQSRQDVDGSLHINEPPLIDTDTLLTFAGRAIDNLSLPFIVGHTIEEYIARISRRCPNIPDPFPADGVMILGATTPAGGLIELGTESIAVGGLVIGGNAIANAELVLIGRLPSPGGSLVLGGPPVAQGELILVNPSSRNCPCCTTADSPAVFTVLIEAPGYWFDGITVTQTLETYPGACLWIGLTETGSYDTMIDTESSEFLGLGVLNIVWVSIDNIGNYWNLPPGATTAGSFTCTPWFWQIVREIWLNGVPTGDFVTITVVSVP